MAPRATPIRTVPIRSVMHPMKHVGWAVEITVKFNDTSPEGRGRITTTKVFCQGETPQAARAAAQAEKRKQLAMPGTISVWVVGEAVSVTAPSTPKNRKH